MDDDLGSSAEAEKNKVRQQSAIEKLQQQDEQLDKKGPVTQQALDSLIESLKGLDAQAKNDVVQSIIFEMNQVDFTVDNKCVLQLDADTNPKAFWWVYDLVQEQIKKQQQTELQVEEEEELEMEPKQE